LKTFAIGDIHGGYKALMQCLEKSNFDYNNDTLICLGDVADGWPEVPECVEELLKIKNLIYVCGNHDRWCSDWFKYGSSHIMWTQQGGQATIDAYIRTGLLVNKKHKEFWENVENTVYYIDKDRNYLFVHGGYNWKYPLDNQPKEYANDYKNVYWDRHMWVTACMLNKIPLTKDSHFPGFVKQFDLIFIGHTTTTFAFKHTDPVKCLNVWNLDQGGGYEGKLTIMDIDTFEYWQSDNVRDLYPNYKGRN